MSLFAAHVFKTPCDTTIIKFFLFVFGEGEFGALSVFGMCENVILHKKFAVEAKRKGVYGRKKEDDVFHTEFISILFKLDF
jgi:hypothetical protein